MRDRVSLTASDLELEIVWQLQVIREAEKHGWEWLHIPRSRVGRVWLTRAKGTLARGWFDLLLVRGTHMIGVELKAEKGRIRPDQKRVHDLVREVIPVYVWRPSDWPEVQDVLR